MRSYEVYIWYHNVNSKFAKITNTACFADLNSAEFHEKEIYIGKFGCKETAKYQKLLVSIINEITSCSIVTIKGKRYIKFLTLKTYNQSLILLNFIRNLWHQPFSGYTNKFFTALEKSDKKYKDPLRRLTWANREACGAAMYPYGHSNACPKNSLKVKAKKQLMGQFSISTNYFLTGAK